MKTQWVATEASFVVGEVGTFDADGGMAGASIATDDANTIMVVGEPEYTTAFDGGRVYTYEWSGSAWVETVGARLVWPENNGGSRFGGSVSLTSDGSVLVVGQTDWFFTGNYDGRVHVYDWSGTAWVHRSDPATPDAPTVASYMGKTVCISGDGEVITASNRYWGSSDPADHRILTWDKNGSGWDLRADVITPAAPADPLKRYWGHDMHPDAQMIAEVIEIADYPNYTLNNGFATGMVISEQVSGLWERTYTFVFPDGVMAAGPPKITPDKQRIFFWAYAPITDYQYLYLYFMEFDGDTWGFDEANQNPYTVPGIDDQVYYAGNSSTSGFGNNLSWKDPDTYELYVGQAFYEEIVPPAPVDFWMVGKVHTIALVSDEALSEVTITGCVERTATSALSGQLEPIRPPLRTDRFVEYDASSLESVGRSQSITADGLTLVMNDVYNYWIWILKRSSVYKSDWEVEIILNRVWNEDGSYWDTDESLYPWFIRLGGNSVSVSADGNTIVANAEGLEQQTGQDAIDYPQFDGIPPGRFGGAVTFKRNSAGEWVDKGWIQTNDADYADGLWSTDISSDGLIMWGTNYINSGATCTVFDWDESLDNWVQRGPTERFNGIIGGYTQALPSWVSLADPDFGRCSGDGSTFTFRCYLNNGTNQFITIIVEWDGGIVQKGECIEAREYGLYAHPVGVDMDDDGTTVYTNMVEGSSDVGWVIAYDFVGGQWVDRGILIGPFYTWAYGYVNLGLTVEFGETGIHMSEFLEDTARNNELWGIYDARFYVPPGFVNPPDYDMTAQYITTYGPQPPEPCFTKIECAEEATLVQVGERCVDWADPPATPPDTNPTLPSPPGSGNENNNELTCEDKGDYHVISGVPPGVAVNDNFDYAQYLADNIENLNLDDPC